MYDLILSRKLITIILAVVLTLLLTRRHIALRSLLFNFTPAIASAFYLLALFEDQSNRRLDLAVCFVFECLILLLCGFVLINMLHNVKTMDLRATQSTLKMVFITQLLLSLPILVSDGFGIFSDGSRIAFLSNNSLAKYLAYAYLLLNTFTAGLIATRVSQRGRLQQLDWLILLWSFVYSVLGGSKGGFL